MNMPPLNKFKRFDVRAQIQRDRQNFEAHTIAAVLSAQKRRVL